MKRFIYSISVAALLAACNNQTATQATETQAVATDSTGAKYIVDATGSTVNWEGKSLSGGHNGTINISEGTISVQDGNITAGSFTIDMNTIKDLDLTDATYNGKLVGHLNDTDFFNVKAFPTGKFDITSVTAIANDTAGNTHSISGNLTLKGQSHNITFPAKVAINGDALEANGSVMINRLDWGITYGSTTAFPSLKAKLKDKAIKDEFKVIIALKAKKG